MRRPGIWAIDKFWGADMRVYQLSRANYALLNLQRSRLKVSTFDDLNDPFELLSASVPESSLRKALLAFKADVHASLGILCFCTNWENPVMWSHYADKHRGVCLGFDIPDQFAIPVRYIKDRQAVKYVDGIQSRGVEPSFAFELMCSKYNAWSYEKEVRMFVGLEESEEDSGYFFYPFGAELTLREMILGHRCTVSASEVATVLGDRVNSVSVSKARLAFNSFRVVTDQRSL